MELTTKFLNDYHITTLLLILNVIIIYLLNRKIRLNTLEILILKEKLNDRYEMTSNTFEKNEQNEPNVLPIELIPSNSEEFKSLLLLSKQATITIFYNNGNTESKIWKATKINKDSNILGNIRSRQEFRNGNWQKENIEKVKLEVITNNSQYLNNLTGNKNIINKDSNKLFQKIYDTVFDDIKSGKIKWVGETQLCIENNRIGFGGDRRSEKKENLNLLFDHFVKTNETSVSSFDKDKWHFLIKKLTNGQTQTIDYIYYRDFIQELLNRYNKKNN